jgi:hypothetical protein
MKTIASAPKTTADLVGTFRTFGDYGPTYQVVSTVNGQKVHVVVVQTGEELDYPASEALSDPESN